MLTILYKEPLLTTFYIAHNDVRSTIYSDNI